MKTWRCFAASRQAGAAIEFAFSGLALFGFILGILNLGLLGFSLGALTHGVQATGRWAATQASASYANNGSTITLPCLGRVVTAFNGYADPPLTPLSQPSASASTGHQTTGNLTLTATWANSTAAGSAPGVYLTLTATYFWLPLGFAAFGHGFPVSLTTAATVMGSSLTSATVATTCN
jgi:hypothetical protein